MYIGTVLHFGNLRTFIDAYMNLGGTEIVRRHYMLINSRRACMWSCS